MTMEPRRRPGFTPIEWAAWLAMALILARYLWGDAWVAAENAWLASIGLGRPVKYLIIVPLGVLWYLAKTAEERRKSLEPGRPEVKKGVLFVSATLLALAGGILFASR